MKEMIENLIAEKRKELQDAFERASEAARRMSKKRELGESDEDAYLDYMHFSHNEVFLEGALWALSHILNSIKM